jgi:hypothetical protein
MLIRAYSLRTLHCAAGLTRHRSLSASWGTAGRKSRACFLQDAASEEDMGQGINYMAAACLLRGQVYEALENRGRAVKWFKAALQVDPFCYDAFTVCRIMQSSGTQMDSLMPDLS